MQTTYFKRYSTAELNQLFTDYRNGDEDALAKLLISGEEYCTPYLSRKFRNQPAVIMNLDEIVILVIDDKVAPNMDKIQKPGSFYSFIKVTAERTALDYIRKFSEVRHTADGETYRVPVAILQTDLNVACNNSDDEDDFIDMFEEMLAAPPENLYELSEEIVHDIVSFIYDRYGQEIARIIHLRCCLKLDFSEIAARLDQNVSTVKTKYYSTLGKLAGSEDEEIIRDIARGDRSY